MSARCNCSKFQFEAPKPQMVAVCHCKSCTRSGGSIGSFNAVVTLDDVKFSKGSIAEMSSYNDSDTDSGNTIVRHFCGTCGSALFSIPEKQGEGAIGYLKVAALEDPDAYAPGANAVLFESRAPGFVRKALNWPEGVQVMARGS